MDHGGRDEPDRTGQRRGRRQLRRAVSNQRARDRLGVPYNVSIAVFGGTAPYLGSWLASKGMPDLFNWYVVALCVISGIAAFGLQDLRGRPLD